MPDISITISTPVLTAGQYFKERHRLLPSGSWSSVTNRTNAPFTVTGLDAGEYEFEFILVMADGTHCPAKYYNYTVQEFTCMDFTVTSESGPYRLKIEYTIPSGGFLPPCGLKGRYRDAAVAGGWALFSINSNPQYIYPSFTARDVVVQVWADMCEEGIKMCYDDEVTAPEPVPCFPLSFTLQSITYNGYDPTDSRRTLYTAVINVLQSSPPTTNAQITINQVGASAGMIPWSTTYPMNNMPATNFQHTVQLVWVYTVNTPQPSWVFRTIDICGNPRALSILFPDLAPKPLPDEGG